MELFPKRKRQILEQQEKIEGLTKHVESLKGELQHAIDIIVAQPDTTETYKGNQYTTYSSQVAQIDKMYNGTADWGNQITRNIVDVRSAFTIGSGIKLKKQSKNADREYDFINSFVKLNKIDFWRSLQWAVESEIEGKFLVALENDQKNKNIITKYIEWTSNEYTVESATNNYSDYEKVTYKLGKTGADKTLRRNQFVYKKFAGRESKVNETTPKIGMIITTVQDLDKALWDWRKINHLFSSPTPYLKCETVEQAKATNQALTDVNWKIGKKLVTTADFSMVGSEMAGSTSIEKEIETKAKFVSGSVGVPVHFLGFVDLMSNRATADNLMELLFSSTSKERTLWMDTYNEIFDKAIVIYNENYQSNLQPGLITVDIPYISAEKLKEIREIWFPIYQDGALSLQTFLSLIPDIEYDEEIEKIRAEKEENANDIYNSNMKFIRDNQTIEN